MSTRKLVTSAKKEGGESVQNYDMKMKTRLISHPIKVIVVLFVRVIVFVVFVLAVVIVTTLTQPQLKQHNHKLNVINISTVPDPI